jgi:sugar lactone lactonase YvrE/thiol-disulfide isomerase/thioredoxin
MARLFRILVLAALGTLIAASVRYQAIVADQPPAPELESKAGWLNTDRPLRLSDELKGHVVLLDFWTYCCINCMHVLPDLEYLEKKYADQPFVVIGVHSAKFRNETDREAIRNAIFRYGVHHPVIIDTQFRLWNAYGAKGWPSFAVVGADGKLVPIHTRFGTPLFITSGEGKREALDAAIGTALDDARNLGILATKKVEYKLDAAVPSASGLSFPGKVTGSPMTADAPGYVFIADSSHNRVIVTSWPDTRDGRAASRLVWTIGDTEPGLADGTITAARFQNPQGLFFDPSSRTLYVADTDNHAIRAIDIKALEADPAAAAVRTIAGTGKQVYDRVGGKAGTAQGMASPWDLLVHGRTIYVAMAGTHQLWTIDLDTGVATAFAGSGVEDIIDGPLAGAALAQPSALSMTPDGSRLYFADSETSAIRYVDMKAETVHTLVGRGLFDFGDVSNTYARSRFQHCLGVAVWPQADDAGHRLFVADSYNHKVKLVDIKAQRVRELLGVGRLEHAKSADDLVLDEPGGVSYVQDVPPRGPTLLIADTNNHRILVADPVKKTWSELLIDGLTHDEPAAPDSPAIVRSVRVKPGEPLKFLVTPALAEGTELNAEAPVGVRIFGAEGVTVAQRTLRSGAFPIGVEVPADAAAGGSVLRVELTYGVCTHGDQGVCMPASKAWEVRLETGGESATVELKE